MKIIIDGSPKEVAALVIEIQERQKETELLTLNISNGDSDDLVKKHNERRKIVRFI